MLGVSELTKKHLDAVGHKEERTEMDRRAKEFDALHERPDGRLPRVLGSVLSRQDLRRLIEPFTGGMRVESGALHTLQVSFN